MLNGHEGEEQRNRNCRMIRTACRRGRMGQREGMSLEVMKIRMTKRERERVCVCVCVR